MIFFSNIELIIIKIFSGSNVVIKQQPTITKREVQDFFTPAENIYNYNGKYFIHMFIHLL